METKVDTSVIEKNVRDGEKRSRLSRDLSLRVTI